MASLVEAKARQDVRVSVCLPARNEEATVGHIVATVRRKLVERVPLVDEVVVIDDSSVDATAEVARWEGARVLTPAEALRDVPPGSGKGNALWSSLYACDGDILVWIDADIRNFRASFVSNLLAPLLTDPQISFVKGYYRRPLYDQPSGGGRVTELMARPVLSLLFPYLTHIVQPLSGEYAGRRSVLETVPFIEGWGVEIGLLIDLVEKYGVRAMAQVDLGVHEHRNRPLLELGPQAMAILVTALRRAGIPEIDGNAHLVRFDEQRTLESVPIEVRERPPIVELPSYREKFGHELTA
jgi:glucosyl-3-phosphoglycerate synthase